MEKIHWTDNLYHTIKEVPIKIKEQIINGIKFYINQYKDISQAHGGANAAWLFYKEIDKSIKDSKEKHPESFNKIKCSKGCFFCCMTHVAITKDEGIVMINEAKEKGLEKLNYDKLIIQSQHNVENWNTMSIENQKCVFLNKNRECSIYEARPSVCRKHLVITDPKYCDPNDYPEHKVGRTNNIEVEILTTAIWNAGEEKSDNMAKILLKLLKINNNDSKN